VVRPRRRFRFPRRRIHDPFSLQLGLTVAPWVDQTTVNLSDMMAEAMKGYGHIICCWFCRPLTFSLHVKWSIGADNAVPARTALGSGCRCRWALLIVISRASSICCRLSSANALLAPVLVQCDALGISPRGQPPLTALATALRHGFISR